MPRVEFALLLAVSFACLVVSPAPAEAASKRCENLRITPDDEKAMRDVVTPLAGQRVIQWSAASYCGGPAGAHSWVPLKAEFQTDGTVIGSSVFCDREPSNWVCHLE